MDLLVQTDPQSYALAARGELLRSDHPQSLRDDALYWGGVSAPAYTQLSRSLAGGASAFELNFGHTFYDHLDSDPVSAAAYNNIIAFPGLGDAFKSHFDLSEVDTVVDIGGGTGLFLSELLATAPALQGTLFEQPQVVEKEGWRAHLDPFEGRATVIAGDFNESLPVGADLYLLVRVLPNWDDETVTALFESCRRAMSDSGRVAIIDFPLKSAPIGRSFAPIGDVNALAHFGGMLRTQEELSQLLTKAGLNASSTRAIQPHADALVLTVAGKAKQVGGDRAGE